MTQGFSHGFLMTSTALTCAVMFRQCLCCDVSKLCCSGARVFSNLCADLSNWIDFIWLYVIVNAFGLFCVRVYVRVCDSNLNQLMNWLFISETNLPRRNHDVKLSMYVPLLIGCLLICLSWASIVSGNQISSSHGWLQLFTAVLQGMNGNVCCEGYTLCLRTLQGNKVRSNAECDSTGVKQSVCWVL